MSLPDARGRLTEIVAMAAVYYIAARLGILFVVPAGYAPAVWPAAGFALAGVLLFGSRIWPGIFLGSFLINALTPVDITSAASIAITAFPAVSVGIGASLQAVVGGFLVCRFVQSPTAFVEARDIIKFFFLAGPVSCLVSATWGVTTLKWAGFIVGDDYLFRWWTWWVGDSIGVLTFTPLVVILAARPFAASLRRKISVCVPLSVAFALVAVFFVYTNSWERDRAGLEFERRTDRLTHQIAENFDRYIGVLHSLEAFYASSDGVSRQDFKTFVSHWFTQDQGIRTLSWTPRVLDSERAAYEQAARKDGLNNFQILEQDPQGQLIRAGRRADYFPVYYFESRGGVRRSLGLDLGFDPVRRAALDQARDTGKPTASDRITLIKDSKGEPSFLVFLPIYQSRASHTLEERRRNLQGYVSGAFRVREIIDDVRTNADVKDIYIRHFNIGSGGEKLLWYQDRSQEAMAKDGHIDVGLKPGAALKRTLSFEFAARRWIFEFSPTSSYLIAQRRWQAWSVLAGGLLFTGLLGSFMLAVTGHTNKLQAINTELQKEIGERKTSQNEVAKYAVIVDSLDEAIVGSTWDGIVTTWNKAAEITYGYAAAEIIGRSISILHPPHLAGELSRQREKLERGQSVGQYETVRIRKDGTEIPVSLTLSIMKDAEGKTTGVASVSRDISARKLAQAERLRHRQEVIFRLHDSVMQSLTAISLHLEAAKKLLTHQPQMAGQELAKIDFVLSDEQQNLRSFIAQLSRERTTTPLDGVMPMAKLEKLVKRLEDQWAIRIEFEVDQEARSVPAHIVEHLDNMIQEGVSNAVRHGHASTVQIKIGHDGEKLVLSITDNGSGFGFQDGVERAANHVGPKMLRKRAASLGGYLNIRSSDRGACVEIRLPLSQPGDVHADQPGYRR